jgi:hypothetical protein
MNPEEDGPELPGIVRRELEEPRPAAGGEFAGPNASKLRTRKGRGNFEGESVSGWIGKGLRVHRIIPYF